MKRCCPECFDDRGLRKNIFPTLSPTSGNCDFCGETDTLLVEPKKLCTYFELVANAYEPSTDGRPLIDWLREDWQLFPSQRHDHANANALLAEVLDDGELVRVPHQRSTAYENDGLVKWESLRDEMMHQNRWFLSEGLDTDRLGTLLGHITAEELPDVWYRARRSSTNEPFTLDEMGAPPKRRASNGRANPAGIPYLYLGSNPQTAAAEVRPHTGEITSVAEFAISGVIKAVDLRNPRGIVSPFLLSDAEMIGQLLADLPLLERLGEELTRPVLPSSAAIDYIPSQYLCEFIRKRGFDGVVYRSSVADGINLALFDTERAEGRAVSQHRVTKVSVEICGMH